MFAHSHHPSIGALALTALAAVALACGPTQPTARPSANPTSTPAPTLPPTQAPTTPPTSSPTPAPTETPGPPALLLEVTTEGGFIAPSAHLGQLPTVLVDSAGDIYTTSRDPGPQFLIPRVVVRNVGPNGAAQIEAAIRSAGLDEESSGGGPSNPDAGVTVFTVDIDGQEIVNRVTDNGGPGPGHPGGSPSPAIDLLNRLLDPGETWGAADVQAAPFTPTVFKIYAAPATDTGGTAVEWPLSSSLANFGTPSTPDFGVTGLRTGAVTGDDATKIAASFASSLPDALVTSDGKIYQVWIRPLLPPELN